jgi:glucose-1-phosphate thymidylyltransferase
MIAILLAGGLGSRLYPATKKISKQLLPVFDKPMIYYPLTTLMFAGVRKIFIVVTPSSIEDYKTLLNDGSQWGLEFEFIIQEKPNGIADSLNLIPIEYTQEPCIMILGDNLFYGSGLGRGLKQSFTGQGALVYAYEVANPNNYGVVVFDSEGKPIKILEKPTYQISNFAIPGLYWFDNHCYEYAKKISLSDRGELEITDILIEYLRAGNLKVNILPRGTAWLDTGTAQNLLAASNFVSVIEERQGLKIGCPEEVAFREEFISRDEFNQLVAKLPAGNYREYLEKLEI